MKVGDKVALLKGAYVNGQLRWKKGDVFFVTGFKHIREDRMWVYLETENGEPFITGIHKLIEVD